eukprot:s1018_g9.t3
MPIGALSAKELMEHGTRGTNEQRAGSPRRARDRVERRQVVITVRDQSCAQQVCVCISVLLRHLAVPPKLLLLDLLLASYLVLRAGDERGTVLRLGGGKVSLHLMQSCWCAVNPFYYREEHPVTALVQCRSIRDARQLLMQIPHFGELALAHVFSYIAAIDKGLQRLSWSQQKLPDAQLPLASNARAWLALRRAGRELTKSPGWLEEEARRWVQTMQAIMPKTVTCRRHSDGVEVEWKPQITRSLCQANSCKSLQVLQTCLSGNAGKRRTQKRRGHAAIVAPQALGPEAQAAYLWAAWHWMHDDNQACDLQIAQKILAMSPKATESPAAEGEASPARSVAKLQELMNRMARLEGQSAGQAEELARLARQQLRCEATTESLEVKLVTTGEALRTLGSSDSTRQLRAEIEALRRGFVQEGQERDDQAFGDLFEHRRLVTDRLATTDRELRRLAESLELQRLAPPPPSMPTAQLQALWDEVSRLTERSQRLEAEVKQGLDAHAVCQSLPVNGAARKAALEAVAKLEAAAKALSQSCANSIAAETAPRFARIEDSVLRKGIKMSLPRSSQSAQLAPEVQAEAPRTSVKELRQAIEIQELRKKLSTAEEETLALRRRLRAAELEAQQSEALVTRLRQDLRHYEGFLSSRPKKFEEITFAPPSRPVTRDGRRPATPSSTPSAKPPRGLSSDELEALAVQEKRRSVQLQMARNARSAARLAAQRSQESSTEDPGTPSSARGSPSASQAGRSSSRSGSPKRTELPRPSPSPCRRYRLF